MSRLRLLALLALVAFALPAAALSAQVDKGLNKPPRALPDWHKSIWMGEWVACGPLRKSTTLHGFARELKMKNAKIVTPQQAAKLLATRAMRFLYEDPEEIKTAIEGCRNGILWRFYHDP